jgi:hypothetical protein
MLDPEDDKSSQTTTYMAIRCSCVWLRLTWPSSVSGIAFLPVVTGFFDTAFFDSGRLCGFDEVGHGIRCCHRTGDATWIVVARCHIGVVAAASQLKIEGERREGVMGRTYGIYTPNEHEPQVGR